MADITQNAFSGGAGLAPGTSTGDSPNEFDLTTALRDVADDLDGIRNPTVAAQSQAELTDNSGGTPATTIAAITNANNAGSADVVPTQNAIASLAEELNNAQADIAALYALVAAAVAAGVVSTDAETYDFSGGKELQYKISDDGDTTRSIEVSEDHFADPALATAAEVVAALNKQPHFRDFLTASVSGGTRVQIQQKKAGENHTFEILTSSLATAINMATGVQAGTGYGLKTTKG